MKSFPGILAIFCIISFLSPVFLYSEETEIEAEDMDMTRETIPQDIATAGYYELLLWTGKLGLDTSGSTDDLRKRLLNYFGETVPDSDKGEEKKTGKSVIIESADELNYIKDIEIDKNYIVLSGKVVLEMVDSDNDTSHKVRADRIILNQDENTISAYGDISYEITSEGEKEYFFGSSLVFQLDSWEGIFFEGVSENNRTVDDEEISFYFSGDSIYRSDEDRILLTKGSITSSKSEDPYYRLDAGKIWVLGSGEWALKNAVFYVGRIPMLYIPYFFKPGDQLVFNPSAGFREVEGMFINTTTYLLGYKEESDTDSFSFMQSDSSTAGTREKERIGMFLRETDQKIDPDSWEYKSGSYLKLFADYYTRKGFFTGLSGEFSTEGTLSNLDFLTAVSISRYIYWNSVSSVYTPFLENTEGDYTSVYEHSYFFGAEIPFRFGFDLSADIKNDWLKVNFDLPVYSDSKFREHFLNRSEGVKWTDFLTGNDDETDEESEMSTVTWSMNTSVTPELKSVSPYIQNLSLDKLNTKMVLYSKVQNYDENPVDLLSFYYPSSIVFPDLSVKLSGSLLGSDSTVQKTAAENTESEDALREPWTEENASNSSKDEENDKFRSPELMDTFELKATRRTAGLEQTLKYSLNPVLTMNSVYSSDIPATTDDINFDPDYSVVTAKTTSTLAYTANIMDDLLKINNTSLFTMNYKEHYNPATEDSSWETYLEQDKNATNYKLTDNLEITTQPFYNSMFWSETAFEYNLNTVLYNRYYDDTEQEFINNDFGWNESSINDHNFSVDLKYLFLNKYQIISLLTELPPNDTAFYPEIVLKYGNISGTLSTGYLYTANAGSDQWILDPYEISLNYMITGKSYIEESIVIDPEDSTENTSYTELALESDDSDISFNQKLKVDLTDMVLTESSTDLNLWFAGFNFIAEDTFGYSLNPSTGWVADTESKFQPSKASASINYGWDPDPFWKNRVRFSADLDTAWTMNLLKYTDTALTFNLGFDLYIAEFLRLTFESKSSNNATFRYLPNENGGVNPFLDLIKSFNFFNREDRVESNFNLDSISISAVHNLSDWDLTVEYSGAPELVTRDDNTKEYEWTSEFSIIVSWNPVPEIKKEITYVDDELDI